MSAATEHTSAGSIGHTLSEQAFALQLMMQCKGHVILSSMGKSDHVGRKIAGTSGFFIHPDETQEKGLINSILIDSVCQILAGQGSTLCNLLQQTNNQLHSSLRTE